MSISISRLAGRFIPVIALIALVVAMDGTWATAQPAPVPPARPGPARTATGAPAPAPSPASSPPATSRTTAAADADGDRPGGRAPRTTRATRKELTGKLNLNTATEEQLLLLPTVGPSKAERVVTWRKKNGGFKRVADLRRVKGFGYKTLKRLEPFLDIQGETTLAVKP